MEQDRNINDKLRDFADLLENIESLDDKKRLLWREIYENAILDRQNSYGMFVKLVTLTKDNSAEHAVHGKTISAYIERMQKANEQLIKLADLIAAAEAKDKSIDKDSLFQRINGG